MPVKVFERLKSKNYPATNTSKVKDIAGRSDQVAIEWALRSGIAGTDTKGKFHPENSLSEAQFLFMLLRTYKVDDESYASKKKKHWAEGAYNVAKARNLLLFSESPGKSGFKDKPMNRNRVAGLIASADGVNFNFPNAIKYVLAHDAGNRRQPGRYVWFQRNRYSATGSGDFDAIAVPHEVFGRCTNQSRPRRSHPKIFFRKYITNLFLKTK
ncbi:hypothetical protein [Paenibacillus cucumis (ex Kampfer et al. 2016)]|uniref:S-layer homology domain-containing protein n=1 Tax=Paenibacillus cucumis (ex Kampfer et al. 2016) TaxID=1776858 RepID=A0ABS7KS09_9BACL|nr:hypothetical protein [Paenibacillus cucumis (ex Kampfer et al. 2016)]MBY0206781.1 S-layer homology domain-containing protein [Paenibacillus cucumis (ex Kampfer et al. 2016)]